MLLCKLIEAITSPTANTGIRVFYLVIGAIIMWLVMVDKREVKQVQHERDVYRDSLAVNAYRINQLTETLKGYAAQDEIEYIRIRNLSTDSLMAYLARPSYAREVREAR
jgi:hypothetical protein